MWDLKCTQDQYLTVCPINRHPPALYNMTSVGEQGQRDTEGWREQEEKNFFDTANAAGQWLCTSHCAVHCVIASLRPLCPSSAVICSCHIGFISKLFYKPHHMKGLLQFPHAFLQLLVRGPAEGLKGRGSPGWQFSVWGGLLGWGSGDLKKVLKPGPQWYRQLWEGA